MKAEITPSTSDKTSYEPSCMKDLVTDRDALDLIEIGFDEPCRMKGIIYNQIYQHGKTEQKKQNKVLKKRRS